MPFAINKQTDGTKWLALSGRLISKEEPPLNQQKCENMHFFFLLYTPKLVNINSVFYEREDVSSDIRSPSELQVNKSICLIQLFSLQE